MRQIVETKSTHKVDCLPGALQLQNRSHIKAHLFQNGSRPFCSTKRSCQPTASTFLLIP